MCKSSKRVFITRRSDDIKVLPLPSVPMADIEDGLLTLEALQNPVIMELVAWVNALPGNSYQLIWNGNLVGTKKTIEEGEVPGTPLTLDIPEVLLNDEGIFKAAYRAVNENTEVGANSDEITLIVDRTRPGGALLAALEFPSVVDDGLTSEELTQMDDILEAKVPGYAGMAWGDHIRSFWGQTAGPEHIVTRAEVTRDYVMLNFDRAFLTSLGDVTEPVFYNVTDRAGNLSKDSTARTFSLFLEDVPEDFPAPVCTQAEDGVIDDADARSRVAVDIPNYPSPAVGDTITLYWGSIALPEAQLESGDETSDPIFAINVPYSIVAQAGDGQVALRYEVGRSGRLVGSSLSLQVNVNIKLPGPVDPDPETPENENLPLPIIRGTSNNPDNQDNVIDEDDYKLDAKAVIPWRAEFVTDDTFNVYWCAQTTPQTYTLRSSDIGNDIVVTIPAAVVQAEGTGAAIRVNYTLNHAGNPNTSKSLPQSVEVRSFGDLPGGEVGLSGPVFTGANNLNVIGPILNPDGTKIFIPPYLNADKYPTVTVVFHGYNAASGADPVEGASLIVTHTLDKTEQEEGYNFTVSDRKLRLICTGRGDAFYRVEGPSGPVNSFTTGVFIEMYVPGHPGC